MFLSIPIALILVIVYGAVHRKKFIPLSEPNHVWHVSAAPGHVGGVAA
jgi:hypothetical protein